VTFLFFGVSLTQQTSIVGFFQPKIKTLNFLLTSESQAVQQKQIGEKRSNMSSLRRDPYMVNEDAD
jgi:hypothetical protein